MPSPSAASENVVVYCAGVRGALSLSLYVKHQMHPPPPGHASHSVCFTRCSALVSGVVRQMRPYMQRVGGRPVIRRPLRIVRYRDMKRHDISISLLGYDMITTCKINKIWLIFVCCYTFTVFLKRDLLESRYVTTLENGVSRC